jgi:hypothetical protein
LPWRPQDRDFDNKRLQLANTAFLEAFEDLRGGGAITNVEGEKGEGAISRLRDPTVSYEDFVQAVVDLEGIIKKGLERQRASAGIQSTSGPTRAQREAEARRRGLIP